jgi:hypothetical protein
MDTTASKIQTALEGFKQFGITFSQSDVAKIVSTFTRVELTVAENVSATSSLYDFAGKAARIIALFAPYKKDGKPIVTYENWSKVCLKQPQLF